MKPTYTHTVDFRRLPTDVQEALIGLQTEGEDRLMFPAKVSRLWLIPIAAAAGWLVYVYTATQQPLWEDWMSYMIGGISVVVFPLSWYAIAKMAGPRLRKLRSGFLVTKDELFRIDGNRVDASNLKDIETLRFKEHDNEIEIWQGGREEKIVEPDAVDAKRLHRVFDDWKKDAGVGIGSKLTQSTFAFNGTRRLLVSLGGLLVAALIGAAVARTAAGMNRAFDDDDTWTRADAANSIEECENYKLRHPHGGHIADADKKISAQLAKVRSDYTVKAAKYGSPDAIAAMTALVDQAINRPDRTIFVRISEDRQVDNAIVEELRGQAGSFVNGYESSVPTNGFVFRQNKVFSDLKVIINEAFGYGIKLELVDSLPEAAPGFHVNLLIRSEKIFYRINSFMDGRYKTDIYAGANFNYKVDLHPPGQAPFHMEYVGQPLQIGSGVFDSRDKENFTFDKLYFSAVTNGFDKTWARTFGFSDNLSDIQ